MKIAQRRSRLATPIGTPGGFGTPGGPPGRHTPQTFPPPRGGPMVPMGVGGPQGYPTMAPPQYRADGSYDRAPSYRDSPPDDEKKPLPSDDEDPRVHQPPPTMKALPGKQVYKRNTPDSELI
jgi:hypothetical protein